MTPTPEALAKAINDDLDLIEQGHLDLVRVVRERLKALTEQAREIERVMLLYDGKCEEVSEIERATMKP